MNLSLGDAVGHHAGVIAHVGGLHLGNVEVSRLLRDEPSVVLLDKVGVLVENPGVSEVWKKKHEVLTALKVTLRRLISKLINSS